MSATQWSLTNTEKRSFRHIKDPGDVRYFLNYLIKVANWFRHIKNPGDVRYVLTGGNKTTNSSVT